MGCCVYLVFRGAREQVTKDEKEEGVHIPHVHISKHLIKKSLYNY